jgi:enoyl-[acyl-carrier protein] reductase/trans-2-enoyl-CoA reductase (NAD+)
MPQQVIKRRSRGFICVNAHRSIRRQVEGELPWRAPPALAGAPRNVLVIGASTGYGLAARHAAWGYGARTWACFRAAHPAATRPPRATTIRQRRGAARDGLFAAHINGDAFSDECKRGAIELIRRNLAPLDLVIYSLASPKRTHPRTGTVHNSVLKPIGQAFSSRTVDLDSEKVVDVTLPPAADKEIADTVAVMGGEDWRMWMEALADEGLLAPGARTVAYSYIGPALTWPIYREGTIGRAKQDLDHTARALGQLLSPKLAGSAWVSVNKAVVTQASAAIPVVPLYLSLLSKVMRKKGLEESPIEQMRRLFSDFLTAAETPATDEAGRIRLDDREMRADVQSEVAALFPQATTENLREISDFAGFQREFRNLFGFEVEGVDYEQAVETDVSLSEAPI